MPQHEPSGHQVFCPRDEESGLDSLVSVPGTHPRVPCVPSYLCLCLLGLLLALADSFSDYLVFGDLKHFETFWLSVF